MFLDEIVGARKKRLESLKKQKSTSEIEKQALEALERNTLPSFKDSIKGEGLSLVGEVKKASPSRGVIRENFNYLEISRIYEDCVEGISVLTEQDYFLGEPQYLEEIATALPHIPLLRKDFIIDPYQLYESRVLGSSAVLLIAAVLSGETLSYFCRLCRELGLETLVEIHGEEELEKALDAGPDIVGINNRNLEDFSVSAQTTLQLAPLVPAGFPVISESGFMQPRDVQKIAGCRVEAILVGEALMRAYNPRKLAEEFKNAQGN